MLAAMNSSVAPLGLEETVTEPVTSTQADHGNLRRSLQLVCLHDSCAGKAMIQVVPVPLDAKGSLIQAFGSGVP